MAAIMLKVIVFKVHTLLNLIFTWLCIPHGHGITTFL